MQSHVSSTSNNYKNRLRTNIATVRCLLLILSVGCLGASCATLEQSKIEDAEVREFHGDTHVCWPYIYAGNAAADKHDWAAAQHWYLRAYRNTGMKLAPREDSPLKGALFGRGADIFNGRNIEGYTAKLDELTPVPGTGIVTNEVLDTAMNYQRSMATYDWARATGRLGDFAGAEKAFLYSLHLEKTRNVPERDRLLPSRYFELARLYNAWGKREHAIQSYRDAFRTLPERDVLTHDPIALADALEEFSSSLDQASQTSEAAQVRARASDIRAQIQRRRHNSMPTLTRSQIGKDRF